LKSGAKTTASPHWAESGYYAGLLLDDLGARLEVLAPPTKMSAEDSAGYKRAIGGQAASFYGRAEDLWIATLEGIADSSAAARDTSAVRPTHGWPGRIFERLEPRVAAHYPWRLAIVDWPAADTTSLSLPDSGTALVADLEPVVAARPAPVDSSARDSTALDAGAREDLRNRLQWIAQYLADGQVDGAAQWAEAAVKSYPHRAEIWNDLGAIRMRQGRWAEGLAAWGEALRLDPRSPGALYNRAVFERFYRLDREAARRSFERFLALGVPFDETLADRMAEEKKP
jgi:tetratricopeptide (TPR) repeat protein